MPIVPPTWEAEAGRSPVRDRPQLHSEFEASLSYVRASLKVRPDILAQRVKLSNFEDCSQGPEAGVDREEERERREREGESLALKDPPAIF